MKDKYNALTVNGTRELILALTLGGQYCLFYMDFKEEVQGTWLS